MKTMQRLYKLSPWIIRMIIPENIIGGYILYELKNGSCVPVYIGRSDKDLRNRLLQHAFSYKGDYFEYMVLNSPEKAFDLECSLYHALSNEIMNKIHPDKPDGVKVTCPFCNIKRYI